MIPGLTLPNRNTLAIFGAIALCVMVGLYVITLQSQVKSLTLELKASQANAAKTQAELTQLVADFQSQETEKQKLLEELGRRDELARKAQESAARLQADLAALSNYRDIQETQNEEFKNWNDMPVDPAVNRVLKYARTRIADGGEDRNKKGASTGQPVATLSDTRHHYQF